MPDAAGSIRPESKAGVDKSTNQETPALFYPNTYINVLQYTYVCVSIVPVDKHYVLPNKSGMPATISR